jgi:hypothetical protein
MIRCRLGSKKTGKSSLPSVESRGRDQGCLLLAQLKQLPSHDA